jgi:uncharacterized protein YcfJ
MLKVLSVALFALTPILTGCTTAERHATGGAVIGGAAGAVIGGATGGTRGALLGTAIGAGTGALAGAVTAPREECVYRDRQGRLVRVRC